MKFTKKNEAAEYPFIHNVNLLRPIWRWGGRPERRLALWTLLTNALPFLLISLTRYQRSVDQAFVAPYAIFIGALLLVGMAWGLLANRLPP